MQVKSTFVQGINPWTRCTQETYTPPQPRKRSHRDYLLDVLKEHGPCTVLELASVLKQSENAVYKVAQRLYKTGVIGITQRAVPHSIKPINVYHLHGDPDAFMHALIIDALKKEPGSSPAQVREKCHGNPVGPTLVALYRAGILRRKRELPYGGKYLYWITK